MKISVHDVLAPTVEFDSICARRLPGVVVTAVLAVPSIVTVVLVMLAGTVVPEGNDVCRVVGGHLVVRRNNASEKESR